MRAFVAIDIPDTIRTKLAEVQQRLGRCCHGARWTRPEGIHLTLKFLGEISDGQTKAVGEKLAALDSFEPFSVEVKGLGCFPSPNRPRVLYAGLSAPAALPDLAARVEGQLEKLGFEREKRPYSPHLTLARFSVPRPQPELRAVLAALAEVSLGKFEVSEFFLFESKLSPQGSRYRKVMRFPRATVSA